MLQAFVLCIISIWLFSRRLYTFPVQTTTPINREIQNTCAEYEYDDAVGLFSQTSLMNHIFLQKQKKDTKLNCNITH